VEVFSKLAERARLTDEDLEDFKTTGITILDFDLKSAWKAADLPATTKHLGLSLGDRTWEQVPGCQVELIR